MENVGLFLNVENLRTLVLLVAIVCGIVWQRNGNLELKIDLLKVMDEKLKAMEEKIGTSSQSLYAQLKANDFKHLNDTIEALTFMLEKNKFLSREDKEYIDGRLDK